CHRGRIPGRMVAPAGRTLTKLDTLRRTVKEPPRGGRRSPLMLRTATTLLVLIGLLGLSARAGDLDEGLLAAAKKVDADTFKALLAKGPDVNAKNAYGATALSFAADKGHLAVVKVLLEHKADVNVKDSFYKSTPLNWAMARRHVDIIKALVKAGATGT